MQPDSEHGDKQYEVSDREGHAHLLVRVRDTAKRMKWPIHSNELVDCDLPQHTVP